MVEGSGQLIDDGCYLHFDDDEIPPLPTRSMSEKERFKRFSIWAEQIRAEFKQRVKKPQGNRGDEKPKKKARMHKAHADWLARAVYQLLSHVIDEGVEDVFARSLKGRKRPKTLSPVALDLFNFGFVAIFPKSTPVHRRVRDRQIRKMLYAYAHYIPPAFLPAFAKEMGGENVIAVLVRDGDLDERYRAWATVQMNRKTEDGDRFSTVAYRRRKLHDADPQETDWGAGYREFDM